MANQFQGLFKGMTVNDALALRNQEREQRIRQAMADNAAAGGGFYSNLIAKANAQQAEAFKAVGQHFGQQLTPDLIKEDPRLTLARKRDTDRTEVLDMLGKFTSDDGKISEDEMKLGFSELMKRGYQDEAQQFLTNAMNMRGLDIKEGQMRAAQTTAIAKLQKLAGKGAKLKFEGPLLETKSGDLYQSAYKENGELVMIQLTGDNKKPFDPAGAKAADQKGSTVEVRINEAIRKAEGVEKLRRGTKEIQAELDRETAKIKEELGVEGDFAKRLGQAKVTARGEAIKSGLIARRTIPQAEKLLDLAKQIKAGRGPEALREFKRFFGIEAKNEAAFRTGAQELMLKQLKAMMGLKPTDKDLEELAKAFPGMKTQTMSANIDMLQRLISRLGRDVRDAEFYAADPKSGPDELFQHLLSQDLLKKGPQAAPPPPSNTGSTQVAPPPPPPPPDSAPADPLGIRK